MADAYKLDKEQVAKLINELKTIRENYNVKIDELKNLTSEINSSTEWIDITVKQEFINTCNSYLQKYENIVDMMEKLIEYLTNKNEEGSSTENSFAKVGMNE